MLGREVHVACRACLIHFGASEHVAAHVRDALRPPDPSEGGPTVAGPGGPTMEATFLGTSLLGLRPRRLDFGSVSVWVWKRVGSSTELNTFLLLVSPLQCLGTPVELGGAKTPCTQGSRPHLRGELKFSSPCTACNCGTSTMASSYEYTGTVLYDGTNPASRAGRAAAGTKGRLNFQFSSVCPCWNLSSGPTLKLSRFAVPLVPLSATRTIDLSSRFQ